MYYSCSVLMTLNRQCLAPFAKMGEKTKRLSEFEGELSHNTDLLTERFTFYALDTLFFSFDVLSVLSTISFQTTAIHFWMSKRSSFIRCNIFIVSSHLSLLLAHPAPNVFFLTSRWTHSDRRWPLLCARTDERQAQLCVPKQTACAQQLAVCFGVFSFFQVAFGMSLWPRRVCRCKTMQVGS